MRLSKRPFVVVVFFISVSIFLQCGDMKDHSGQPETINISGTVNNGEVSSATVMMTNMTSGEIVSTTGDDKGKWILPVQREKMVSGDTFLLSATNPSNGMTLRSMIGVDDILKSDNSFSSEETVISSYTEAIYLFEQGRPLSDIAEFLKQTNRLTDFGMPKSTGKDSIDALASWIGSQFTDSEASPDKTYSLNLLEKMISCNWPAIFVSGTDSSFKLPSNLLSQGITVSVSSYNTHGNITVDDDSIKIGAEASESIETEIIHHEHKRSTAPSGEAETVVVENEIIKIVTGSNLGTSQVVLNLDAGSIQKELTLPVNILGIKNETSQTVLAKDVTPMEVGPFTLVPGSQSFLQDTIIRAVEFDQESFESETIGELTVISACRFEMTSTPEEPLSLLYQLEDAGDADSVVLVVLNAATKTETYLYPDLYDEEKNQLSFSLEGSETLLVGKKQAESGYTPDAEITVSDLLNNSANAFSFIRQVIDKLNHPNYLDAISAVSDNGETCTEYMTLLSSKALSSLMALPEKENSGMEDLKAKDFNATWCSLSSRNAWDEYYLLRSRLMQVLYKITNSTFDGLNWWVLFANLADDESALEGSVLGVPDSNANYYFPMIAYRLLNIGCTSPDIFFEYADNAIKSGGDNATEIAARYQEIIDWIRSYIEYKLFTSPKVPVDGMEETDLIKLQNDLVQKARYFMDKPMLADYAGLWLGGSYVYSEENNIQPAKEGFSVFNDTLSELPDITERNSKALSLIRKDGMDTMDSTVRDRKWVDHGEYYIPAEVDDEISALENWLEYFKGLNPAVSTWYRDNDGDGYGNPDDSVEKAAQPDGYVSDNTDPDDSENTIYPGAPEICGDELDNDRNGETDEGCGDAYKGTETNFSLLRRGFNQYLLPVEVGSQTLNLLVDTGSNALLVFKDKLNSDSTVVISDEKISKSYVSTVREGYLATAPVRIGGYYDPDMKIMVITSPDSSNDPSLTAKKADGIIGFRRTQGLAFSNDKVFLDVPLNELTPAINIFELNLPPSGIASLSLGKMSILDRSRSSYVFKAKTYTFEDPVKPFSLSYADLQVPFRAKSRAGEANEGELDVLLDSGAVSKLVLDTEVAKSLGYDPSTESWSIPEDDEIEFSLVGPRETIPLYPKFKVSEISVSPFQQMGVTYEAVLGIDRWQHYVVGFSFVDFQSEGPDGTLLMMFRPNMAEAFQENLPGQVLNYQELPGLNSIGDDRFPTADDRGDVVAFQSNRLGGMGGWDVYVWKKGLGLIETPGLNSEQDDGDPSLTGDGRYMVFHSIRAGGTGDWDIYMYDLRDNTFVALPGLNTASLERTPTISRDGRYIAFRSAREGITGVSDIFLYDRNTSKLIDLPGINSDQGDYDPVINGDGTLIAFDNADESTGVLNAQSFLYNVAEKKLDQLENINTDMWEMDTVISPDGKYLSFHANYNNPEMELYDRDFYLYNIETSTFEVFSGLNSAFDEEGLCFTGDSRNMLFHSNRPGGEGGSDIYFYSIFDNTPSEEDASDEVLPKETVTLDHSEQANVFTIQAVTSDGEALTFLLEMGLEGVVLFEDQAPSGAKCGGPKSIHLPYGTINAKEQICLDLNIANITLNTTFPLIDNQAVFNTLVGRSDLPEVDGVIGFRGRFVNEFCPEINLLELCTINGKDRKLNDDIVPGITIGSLPMISTAKGQGQYLFESSVDGYEDPVDPFNGSYTNMDIPFVARTDTAVSATGLNQVVLSTVLDDQLILDYKVAENLGYSSVKGWGKTKTVSIFFVNDDFLLPADMGAYPIKNIIVRDLSDLECQAVLSSDRWTDQFFVGYQIRDYQSGGPSGTISLLHVKDLYALQGSFYETGKNYVPLPGLNSSNDDLYPTISLDGQVIAFQSNRGTDIDVYVYRLGYGILDLPGINSSGDDGAPYISGDGKYVTFHSDRSGDYDIYLYDIMNETFIALPGLNTEYLERTPAMSADGKILTFRSERSDSIDGGSDLFLYNLETKEMAPINYSWLNTAGFEYYSFLNEDGTLISFCGDDRDDSAGGSDVYLYDLSQGKLRELPDHVNTEDYEYGVLGPDGKYMAISTYYDVANSYLLEMESGEYIYLPGLNTSYNDGDPVLSANAQYVAFDSDRPGGQGGWDIYLYQRDETDTNTYTVTNEYEQEGYVADGEGNRAPDETVNAYDKSGTLLGSATTDSEGNFSLTVPLGTQLPITYETETEGLVVVTDDVGDDTYVPDFEAGNLKFTEVWIEDKAEAGLTSRIHFNIEATMPNYNIYINVYLVPGNPSEVSLGENFTADYELTALVIDRLGFRGVDADPVTKKQKDTVTEITYLSGTDNSKAYVEHRFLVPQGIPDGLYTAVFAINTYDVTSEDDAIQKEESTDLSDNYMVASASTIIGNPDKPNLRILSSELYTNSFELPSSLPAMDYVPEYYDFSLNLEVESMAQDAILPVDVIFELDIAGVKYPLVIAESDGSVGMKKIEKQTYDVTCRDEDRPGYPDGERCASLFRQEQTGKTYSLYLGEDAYRILSGISEDTLCTLVATVDPDNTIEEYENNKADNILEMPVMFLPPEPEVTPSAIGDSENIFNLTNGNSYGNDDFAVGYHIGPRMDYKKTTWEGIVCPYAASFDGTNTLWVKVFGHRITILDVGPSFNFDCSTSQKVEQSYFDYSVDILGFRIWGQKHTIGNHLDDGEYVFWDTTDDEGNQEYALSKEYKKTKTFNVGPVPVTVVGGVTGEIGIRGEIKYRHLNKLVLEAGPYVRISGMAEAGIGVPGFTIGVGIELLILDLILQATPSIQILPDFPVALVEFKAPIILTTLDGRAYAFARAFFFSVDATIIAWSGYTYEYNFFAPLYEGYGAVDLYKSEYYATPDWSGTGVSGGYEGILYHNWGDGGPSQLSVADNFSAKYYGYFEFPGWEDYTWGDSGTQFTSNYTFYLESDDYMTVKIEDGDTEKIIAANSSGTNQVNMDVSTGFHKISVDYHENSGSATAKLHWVKDNQFACFYYASLDLNQDPVFFESTERIDFDWGLKSPKPGIVPVDNFAVKYEGKFYFPETTEYQFIAKADDSILVMVDGDVIMNGGAYTGTAASKTLSKGYHYISVVYFEYTLGASIYLNWAPKNNFVGAYYNNRTFTGPPALISLDSGYLKSDPGLWDKWFLAHFENGAPASVNPDNFSVRWEGCFEFTGGEYDIVLSQNDAVSLYIDNELVDSNEGENTAKLVSRYISPGWHVVRINMNEYNWWAYASVKWGLKQKNILTETYMNRWSKTVHAINRRALWQDGNESGYIQNWGHGAPITEEVALYGDDFNVVVEGDIDFEGSAYLFSVGADDIVVLYIDNVEVMRGYWKDWHVHFYEAIAMNKGTHHIKAWFEEGSGGAWTKVKWEKIEPEKFHILKFDHPAGDYYYRGITSGNSFDYNWGSGQIDITGDGIGDGKWDGTVIQFIGVFTFEKDANYIFSSWVDASNDFIGLIIDGHEVARSDGSAWPHRQYLKKGTHSVRAYYYEHTGNAQVSLSWCAEGDPGCN